MVAVILLPRTLHLLGAVGLLFALVMSSGFSTDPAAVAVIYLLANVAIFSYVVLHPARGGVSFVISFFFLFFVAVPSLAQIAQNTFPFGSVYTGEELVSAYLVLTTAQLAYMFGELVADSRPPTLPARIQNDRSDLRVARVMRKSVYLLIPVNFALAAAVGPSRLFITRGERGETGEADWLQTLFVGRSLSLLAIVMSVYLLRTDPSARKAPAFQFATAASI